VSREEILMHETVFRGLLQKTKDTITQAVKDNLPPEIGEMEKEVLDLVYPIRPSSKDKDKKKKIADKMKQLILQDSKKSSDVGVNTKEKVKETDMMMAKSDRKPAQLTKNASAALMSHAEMCHEDKKEESKKNSDSDKLISPPADVVLKTFNRPSTPGKPAIIDRKIGSTKVAAMGPGNFIMV
jgi:hypothetical protein